MVRRYHEYQAIFAERNHHDLRVFGGIGHEPQVDAAADHIVVDLVRPRVLDVYVDLREFPQVLLQVWGQLVQPDAVDDGDPQRTADDLGALLQLGLDLAILLEDLATGAV